LLRTKPPHPTDVHVGQRIRMRRIVIGLSQSDLGKTCGISFQQIQKYEKGNNRVSASRLEQFAKILDVPVSFFFEGRSSEGSKHKNPTQDLAQQLLATRDGIELAKAFVTPVNRRHGREDRKPSARPRQKVTRLVRSRWLQASRLH
jgi:transcriptional regulator with XRE-family HTH domain